MTVRQLTPAQRQLARTLHAARPVPAPLSDGLRYAKAREAWSRQVGAIIEVEGIRQLGLVNEFCDIAGVCCS